MRALVVYASKMGGTEGIAKQVRDAFVDRGLTSDVADVADARSLDGYDAVVIGSGLYATRWRRSARRFVRRNVEALQAMPVWFFSSGPLDPSAAEHDIPPVGQVHSLMECVGSRGHATFGGRLPVDAKGFPASAMAKKNAGDWRDAEQIRSWANEIVDDLTSTVTVSPVSTASQQ
ncbi:MAG: menaquinone-dependent protoporphyrinogen oxidase [Actinomycetota bacterium]|jgi:menaquinone-dependent protoporphyrinogen oxidase|nr:menaquinone-dependent protoporphyrinogen oxidase [Actinomycetota bacterium]MDQ1478991.1 menaquinone-dependent protoporphyrinogen oxidase [Actinomycetota bacterium]